MSAPSLQSLCSPLTPDQVRSFIYSILGKVGIDTTAWQPGSVVRTLIAVIATLFSAYTYWASAAIQGLHLLLASGDWLDSVALYDYGTTRNVATYAGGPVTLVNTGAGVYSYNPGQLTLQLTKTPTDGTSTPVVYYYSNTQTVNVAGYQSQSIQIQAQQSGTAANYTNGSGATFSAVGNSAFTVTPTTSLLGADPESDQALKNRASLAASALSPNGPSDAYNFIATSVLDANGANYAIKSKALASPGNVTLYVAGPSGSISGTANDATTPLGAINQAIQTNVVPLGVTCTLASCTALPITIAYTVWASKLTTLSSDSISAYIYSALNAYINEFPIGGYPPVNDGSHTTANGWIYVDQLKAIIEGALDLPGISNPIFHTTLTVTANGIPYVNADIPMATSDVVSLANVTPLVNKQ